jgi:hypothetical protein
MDSNWAAEHLQTIRTLMERSAIYRRALAPTMLAAGAIGIGFGTLGWLGGDRTGKGTPAIYDNPKGFVFFWIGAAILGMTAALFIVRRQAFSAAEPFWSPATRRVAQAAFPALLGGLALAVAALGPFPLAHSTLISLWMVLYGCALHAAAFFMQRGVRWFAGLYVLGGVGALLLQATGRLIALDASSASLAMGLIFGAGHLLYGVYLWMTEPRNSTP